MTTNKRLTREPESCLSRQELELLEQARSWANSKLTVANKLCEGYPNDVRLAKEREKLLGLVQAVNAALYFYAL